MLYTSGGKDFSHQVHPRLQQRIRLFMLLSVIMFVVVVSDVIHRTLSLRLALFGIAFGCVVGFITSRVYNLSWDRDGLKVVGSIDIIGWIVLILYIGFECVRATIFQSILHTASSSTAITFAFVAAALFTRVLGLRGRIIRVLKKEKVFAL